MPTPVGPLRVTVVLGGGLADSAAGACGSRDFAPSELRRERRHVRSPSSPAVRCAAPGRHGAHHREQL